MFLLAPRFRNVPPLSPDITLMAGVRLHRLIGRPEDETVFQRFATMAFIEIFQYLLLGAAKVVESNGAYELFDLCDLVLEFTLRYRLPRLKVTDRVAKYSRGSIFCEDLVGQSKTPVLFE